MADTSGYMDDRLPYQIARNFLPQGPECDELARLIRVTIRGYAEGLIEIAKQEVQDRELRRAKAARHP